MHKKKIHNNRISIMMPLTYQWHFTVLYQSMKLSWLRSLLVAKFVWTTYGFLTVLFFVCPLLSSRSCQMGFVCGILGRVNSTLSYWLTETVFSQSCTTVDSRWRRCRSQQRKRKRLQNTLNNLCCCPSVWTWASLFIINIISNHL